MHTQNISQAGRSRMAGFGLLEVLIAISIAGVVIAASYNTAMKRLQDVNDQSAAKHMKTVSAAYAKYIKDNFAPLQAAADAATPAIVTFATLQAAGYLEPSYQNVNPYNQTYALHVLEPVAGRLDGIVVTRGGETISETRVPRIGSMVGAEGGYIPLSATTTARGSFGGWVIPNTLNYWNGAYPNPGAGHLVTTMSFNTGGLLDDFLYRNVVPGYPEANRMNTAIDMNNNSINNVATLQLTTEVAVGTACPTNGVIARDSQGAVVACRNLVWRVQGSYYWEDPVPTFAMLPACTLAEVSQTRVVQAPTVGTGPRAYTCDGTVWQPLALDDNSSLRAGGAETNYGALTVQGAKNGWSGTNYKNAAGVNQGTLMMNATYSGFYNAGDNGWRWYTDENGNTYQAGTAQTGKALLNDVVAVGDACAPDGLVAREAGGKIVTCQSGLWGRSGFTSITTQRIGLNGVETNIGAHSYCSLGRIGNADDENQCWVYESGGDWFAKGHSGCGGFVNCFTLE